MPQKPFAFLAQINCIACDLVGNAARIARAAQKAAKAGAALCVTPAMSLSGAPIYDWRGQKDFRKALKAQRAALKQTLAQTAPGLTVVVGAPAGKNKKAVETLFVLRDGKCLARISKRSWPDGRNAGKAAVLSVGGLKVGFAFAEDLLRDETLAALQKQGAEVLCACGAWVYERNNSQRWRAAVRAACARRGLPLIAVNLAGGQDEFVFEGNSFAAGASGREVLRLSDFEADEAVLSRDRLLKPARTRLTVPDAEEELFKALVVAVRDYAVKNGFHDALLGLSGGADSALVAAIAVEALGKEHVHAVMMPTRYTSELSLRLARQCAESLGIDYRIRPIGVIYDAAAELLKDDFAGTEPGLTEENLQARSRGLALMALSNKFGWLTLATGNKSESATGYCTLYGDTAGGFAPIKDVLKTDVWALMRAYNRMKGREAIAEEIITRPPSAELKHGQTDEAALMPYERLDAILRGLLENGESIEMIAARGIERGDVLRVASLLARNEYKRRQCPTGPKVSRSALGLDVRLPMTSRPSFL